MQQGLIIFCKDFKVGTRMLAHGTFFRDFLPFENIAAVSAVPLHRSILFEDFPLRYSLQ
jgi:hypothetical protein